MNVQFKVFIKQNFLLLMLFGCVLFFSMIGCDRTARYKILTFFFEGVPSPDGKRFGSEPNIISVTNVEQFTAMNTSRTVEPDKWGQRIASRHDFVKDCAQCHMGDLRSGRQELKEPVPDLCYGCHTNLHQGGDYLHGPLNVGECVFCHDPHQSSNIHLQKAPQPDLCYLCHMREDIAMIPEHEDYLDGVCTDCHDPHSASGPELLKIDAQPSNDPNFIN